MDRRKIGGLAFLACLQFFVAERVCAGSFLAGYSYFRNYISDLGAAGCTLPGVCSPLHAAMNASFALQGALIAAGAAALWPCYASDRWARAALACLLTCALGIGLVAVAPEDVAAPFHYAGAGLHLIPCNLAMVFFAAASRRPPLPRALFAAVGALGLAGVAGSALHIYLGLGPGCMERIAAYPFLFTLIAAGGGLLVTSASRPAVRPGFPEA